MGLVLAAALVAGPAAHSSTDTNGTAGQPRGMRLSSVLGAHAGTDANGTAGGVSVEQDLAIAEWALLNDDDDRALPILSRLAEQGVAEAQLRLGAFYDDRALPILSRLAEQGIAEAQFILGDLFAHGWRVKADVKKALGWLGRAAEQGHAGAMSSLALLYAQGDKIPQDCPKALDWATRAVQAGDAIGFLTGCDAQEYVEKGLSLRKEACERGHASACSILVADYELGRGGAERNDAEATRWSEKAAMLGDAHAQYVRGRDFYFGHGVPKDDAEAVRWFRKAAEQGDAEAQFRLALCFSQGEGVPTDDAAAARWYRRAAVQGYPYAQLNLAAHYLKGWGVQRDDTRAYFWWNVLAATGHELAARAAELRDGTAASMSRQQIAEAQRMSREFLPVSEMFKTSARDRLNRARDLKQRAGKGLEYAPTPELVREAQEGLRALHFDPGPADGVAGAKTRAAIREFQRWVGAEADGLVSRPLIGEVRILVSRKQEGMLAMDWVQYEKWFQTSDPPQETPATTPELAVSGSGFFVNAADVVTNHHVVNGCTEIRIRAGARSLAGRLVVANAADDVAVVRTDGGAGRPATFRASGRLDLGEAVMVCGFPLAGLLADDLNVASGEASALSGPANDARFVQISAPVQQGNSGGPLLGADGYVIGMVTSKLDALEVASVIGDIPQNVNFALKGAVVKATLDIHNVPYSAGSESPKPDRASMANDARGFTVAVECYR